MLQNEQGPECAVLFT